jgi:hypothetical protein
MKLNTEARETLRAYGVSQAAWTRHHFGVSYPWRGDACGCPDDRCIGYHHFGPDCGCLEVLLSDLKVEQ